MMKQRAFQVLITVLVAVGLHLCCCQLPLFSCHTAGGAAEAATCEDSHASCHHDHDAASTDDPAPDVPLDGQHSCCGLHDKPLTSHSPRFELPPVDLVSPMVFGHEAPMPSGRGPESERVQFNAPRPVTSLLGCHCALIV